MNDLDQPEVEDLVVPVVPVQPAGPEVGQVPEVVVQEAEQVPEVVVQETEQVPEVVVQEAEQVPEVVVQEAEQVPEVVVQEAEQLPEVVVQENQADLPPADPVQVQPGQETPKVAQEAQGVQGAAHQVLADQLAQLGAEVEQVQAPFIPEILIQQADLPEDQPAQGDPEPAQGDQQVEVLPEAQAPERVPSGAYLKSDVNKLNKFPPPKTVLPDRIETVRSPGGTQKDKPHYKQPEPEAVIQRNKVNQPELGDIEQFLDMASFGLPYSAGSLNCDDVYESKKNCTTKKQHEDRLNRFEHGNDLVVYILPMFLTEQNKRQYFSRRGIEQNVTFASLSAAEQLRIIVSGIKRWLLLPSRRLVSQNRRRYEGHGLNLDLSYITDRIVAMGYPSSHFEYFYRNSMKDTKKFLNQFHHNHYWVFNLRGSNSYSTEHFFCRISSFDMEDHCPPPLEFIAPFCRQVEQWMNKDSRNTIAVHCKAGKGRTGVMIAAYLTHINFFPSPRQVLDYYSVIRTNNNKGVTIPSQRRYIYYYKHLVDNKLNYQPMRCELSTIKFEGLPDVSTPYSLRAFVYNGDILVYESSLIKIEEGDVEYDAGTSTYFFDQEFDRRKGHGTYYASKNAYSFPISDIYVEGDVRIDICTVKYDHKIKTLRRNKETSRQFQHSEVFKMRKKSIARVVAQVWFNTMFTCANYCKTFFDQTEKSRDHLNRSDLEYITYIRRNNGLPSDQFDHIGIDQSSVLLKDQVGDLDWATWNQFYNVTDKDIANATPAEPRETPFSRRVNGGEDEYDCDSDDSDVGNQMKKEAKHAVEVERVYRRKNAKGLFRNAETRSSVPAPQAPVQNPDAKRTADIYTLLEVSPEDADRIRLDKQYKRWILQHPPNPIDIPEEEVRQELEKYLDDYNKREGGIKEKLDYDPVPDAVTQEPVTEPTTKPKFWKRGYSKKTKAEPQAGNRREQGPTAAAQQQPSNPSDAQAQQQVLSDADQPSTSSVPTQAEAAKMQEDRPSISKADKEPHEPKRPTTPPPIPEKITLINYIKPRLTLPDREEAHEMACERGLCLLPYTQFSAEMKTALTKLHRSYSFHDVHNMCRLEDVLYHNGAIAVCSEMDDKVHYRKILGLDKPGRKAYRTFYNNHINSIPKVRVGVYEPPGLQKHCARQRTPVLFPYEEAPREQITSFLHDAFDNHLMEKFHEQRRLNLKKHGSEESKKYRGTLTRSQSCRPFIPDQDEHLLTFNKYEVDKAMKSKLFKTDKFRVFIGTKCLSSGEKFERAQEFVKKTRLAQFRVDTERKYLRAKVEADFKKETLKKVIQQIRASGRDIDYNGTNRDPYIEPVKQLIYEWERYPEREFNPEQVFKIHANNVFQEMYNKHQDDKVTEWVVRMNRAYKIEHDHQIDIYAHPDVDEKTLDQYPFGVVSVDGDPNAYKKFTYNQVNSSSDMHADTSGDHSEIPSPSKQPGFADRVERIKDDRPVMTQWFHKNPRMDPRFESNFYSKFFYLQDPKDTSRYPKFHHHCPLAAMDKQICNHYKCQIPRLIEEDKAERELEKGSAIDAKGYLINERGLPLNDYEQRHGSNEDRNVYVCNETFVPFENIQEDYLPRPDFTMLCDEEKSRLFGPIIENWEDFWLNPEMYDGEFPQGYDNQGQLNYRTAQNERIQLEEARRKESASSGPSTQPDPSSGEVNTDGDQNPLLAGSSLEKKKTKKKDDPLFLSPSNSNGIHHQIPDVIVT